MKRNVVQNSHHFQRAIVHVLSTRKEALHLSEKEQILFVDCLKNIRQEIEHTIDRLSKRLIATNIELLLNYCLRFYERQFITREPMNRDLLMRFESLIDNYISSGKAVSEGLPTVKFCASELCLSPDISVISSRKKVVFH